MTSAAVHLIDDTGQAAAALHPIRQRLLGELVEPNSAAGLARRLGLPRQKVNYHLRQLEEEGLVRAVGERRVRNCTERIVRAVARSYLISPSTMGAVAVDPSRVRDQASTAYLVATSARTVQEMGSLRERADGRDKRLATLTLDAEVRFDTPAAQSAFAEELSNAVADLVAKYHREDAQSGRTFRVITQAYPKPKPPTSQK